MSHGFGWLVMVFFLFFILFLNIFFLFSFFLFMKKLNYISLFSTKNNNFESNMGFELRFYGIVKNKELSDVAKKGAWWEIFRC